MMNSEAYQYKRILGVRTKGGFPTIVFENFIDLEQIEGDQRFYDKKTGDYLVVKDRIVYLWNEGQTDLSDYYLEKSQDLVKKALFPKDKRSRQEIVNEARHNAGLPPKEPKPFVGKDGIYVPIFDTTMEKSKLDEFKRTMKEMGIEEMQEEDVDDFIRNMDGASR